MENITFTPDNVNKFVKVAKAYMNVARRCKANEFHSDTRFAVMVRKSYGVKMLALLMQSGGGVAPETVAWCVEYEEGDGKSFYYLLGAEAFVKSLGHCGGVVAFAADCEPIGGYSDKATVSFNGSVVNLKREGISNTYVKECPAEYAELPLCPSAELFFEGSDFAQAVEAASKNLAEAPHRNISGVNLLFDKDSNVLKVRATDRFKISEDVVQLGEGSFSAFTDTLNITSDNHALMERVVKAMGMRGDSRLEVGVDEYERKFMVIRNNGCAVRVKALSGYEFPENANIGYFTERSSSAARVVVGLREFEKVAKNAAIHEENGLKVVQLAFSGSSLTVGTADSYTTMSVSGGSGKCLAIANYDLLLNTLVQAKIRADKKSVLVIEMFIKSAYSEDSATYLKISLDNVEGSTLIVMVRPTFDLKRLDTVLDAEAVEVVDAETVEVVDSEPKVEPEPVEPEPVDVKPDTVDTKPVEAVDAEPTPNEAKPDAPTVALAKPTPVESKQIPSKPVERVEPVKPHALTVTAPAGVPAKEIPELAGMGHAKAFRDLRGRKLAYVASDGKRCVVVWRDWYKRDDKELVSRVANYVASLGFVA